MKKITTCLFIWMLVILSGCCSQKAPPRTGLDVAFTVYGFPHNTNPYTVEDLSLANEFLQNRIEFYNLSTFLSAYLIPMERSNRILFVPVRPEYKPTDEVLNKIRTDLDVFLKNRIDARAVDPKGVDMVGWKKAGKR